MVDRVGLLRQKSNPLLKEANEVSVEVDRLEKTISEVPHAAVSKVRVYELGP